MCVSKFTIQAKEYLFPYRNIESIFSIMFLFACESSMSLLLDFDEMIHKGKVYRFSDYAFDFKNNDDKELYSLQYLYNIVYNKITKNVIYKKEQKYDRTIKENPRTCKSITK